MSKEKEPELPAPKHCPFCGKPPMTIWRKGSLLPFVYCLTAGCITYGKPEMAMRLDVWNSRVIQIDEHTMKLAQIGEALLRHTQTDIQDTARIKEALVRASTPVREMPDSYAKGDEERSAYYRERAEHFARYAIDPATKEYKRRGITDDRF